MGLFHFERKGPPTHKEKVRMAYDRFNKSMVGAIFPKGKGQADKIICSLAVICGIKLEEVNEEDYFDILKIYVDVLIRKRLVENKNKDIIERICFLHERFIPSMEMARNVVVYAIMNGKDPDFELRGEQDMALLLPPGRSSEVPKREGRAEHAFYFENAIEMITYGAHVEGGDDVRWLEGDTYINLFRKGYMLVEIGQLEEAIEVLKESLEWNPIGIGARFEMCEAYIQLRDFAMAKRILFDMANYLYDPEQIARLYRRMGFIAVEEENYLCAAACFMYSEQFAKHELVNDELQYIREKAKLEIRLSKEEIRRLLKENHIPIVRTPEEDGSDQDFFDTD